MKKNKSKKTQTNTEFLTHLMDFSPAGPMAQMFIIEAIRKYAEQVSENEDQIIKQMEGGFVSGEAWVHTAKSIASDFKIQYGE